MFRPSLENTSYGSRTTQLIGIKSHFPARALTSVSGTHGARWVSGTRLRYCHFPYMTFTEIIWLSAVSKLLSIFFGTRQGLVLHVPVWGSNWGCSPLPFARSMRQDPQILSIEMLLWLLAWCRLQSPMLTTAYSSHCSSNCYCMVCSLEQNLEVFSCIWEAIQTWRVHKDMLNPFHYKYLLIPTILRVKCSNECWLGRAHFSPLICAQSKYNGGFQDLNQGYTGWCTMCQRMKVSVLMSDRFSLSVNHIARKQSTSKFRELVKLSRLLTSNLFQTHRELN